MVVKRLYTFFGIALVSLVLFSAQSKKNNNRKKGISEVALGKLLFFETRLSSDGKISCASCHKPEFAFADNQPFSIGVEGRKTSRNTPSAMNMASREIFFWDGRAASLEAQIIGPLTHPNEMNMTVEKTLALLNADAKYKKYFKQVFNSVATEENFTKAIASYERSLETSHTANDRWIADQPNGLTEQQLRGREVFFNKGKCIECHFTPDFTGDEFRNIGLLDNKKWKDSGRYNFTKKMEDIGKFKVPGLRNVAMTAPYMHDGSFATLRDVIKYYNTPAAFITDRHAGVDTLLIQPLQLSEAEMTDLETFLHGLTDDQFLKKSK